MSDDDDGSVDEGGHSGDVPPVGQIIGDRYWIGQPIGSGSSGTVFEAQDLRLGRPIAVKLLHPRLARRSEIVSRFCLEAMLPANVLHPNVLVVHDYRKRRDGAWYIVQELLCGVTLRKRLTERGRLSLLEAIDIMVPIMGALVAIHRKDFVHRDVKPENIFLHRPPDGADHEIPKLLDFGIAKYTAPPTSITAEHPVGTAKYMAPEQITDSDTIDGRVDVWAVGTILFELVAGTWPFGRPRSDELLRKLATHERPPRISASMEGVPSDFADILARALEPQLDLRYESMAAFVTDLLAFAGQLDPHLAQRHFASIPSELGLRPPPRPPRPPAPPRPTPVPLTLPEPDEIPTATHEVTTDRLDLGALAEKHLEAGDLELALERAGQAARSSRCSNERRGHLRLIQATACAWLGRLAAAKHWARDALTYLPRGSDDWHALLGHLATTHGSLGESDDLHALVADLERHPPPLGREASYLAALCQAVLVLVRTGAVADARRLFQQAEATLTSIPDEHTPSAAWRDVAQAELALHEGDIITYLHRLESAKLGFQAAGDTRNTCVQHANIGNAHMLLGAYAKAEDELRAALHFGEPTKLGLVVAVRANLAFTLARLARFPEARQMANAAITLAVAQHHRRAEAFNRLYLAQIHWLAGDLPNAHAEVERAIAAADHTPAALAQARALLANLHLARSRPKPALVEAREAMRILRSLEGIEQGESLIRLAEIRALRAHGKSTEADERTLEARRRLLLQAARIADPAGRRSFLENIPENAELLRFDS